MKKLAVFIGLVLVVVSFIIFIKRRNVVSLNKNSDIRVFTSFYPLYYFTNEIGKGAITVTNLTPPGAEPHDFEPTAQDIAQIQQSKLLVLNGAGMESYGEKLKGILDPTTTTVLTISEGLTRENNSEVETDEDSHSDDEHNHKGEDPHVWLDPVLAKDIVIKIKNTLISIDPANTKLYESNSEALTATLTELDTMYKQNLFQCKKNIAITSHAAFGYVASRYGFREVALSGLSPEQEPSAQELARIADLVREHSVSYIFFETLISPRLAETLAHETNTKTLVFNPLEGLTQEEIASGETYFSVQQQNVNNLKLALECE